MAMRNAVGTATAPLTAGAERGAIIRFAQAIGDDNPRFTGDVSAAAGPHGDIVAPPTFLRALGQAIPALPDGGRAPRVLDGGSEWTYGAPVRAGDAITFTTRLDSLTERSGRLGPMLLCVYVTDYANQRGELVAAQRNTLIRMGPSGAEASESHVAPGLHEALQRTAIMSAGLYFEDVQAGDELPPLVKRPTTRQLVMYAGAARDFYEIHYDHAFAMAEGLSGVIVHGALKSAFLGQLVTDWMGPEGWLRALSARYREMDVPGDTLTCRGVVTKRSETDAETLVECELWLENGAGVRTTTGEATVALPRRPT